ncbi:unnamed protein product, partial [Heterosigma akashiwo]
MLENRELIPLLELLNDDSGSLESLAAAFARTFARSDHFRVGLAVSSLLEDNLLTRTQRSWPSPCCSTCTRPTRAAR